MHTHSEVWLLIDSSGIGGIETHLLQLASALQENGLTIRIVFLKSYGDHPLLTELRSRGINYYFAKGLIGLIKPMYSISPGIIHTHGYKAGIIGRILGKCTAIPTLSTFHAGERAQGRVAVYDWLDRMLAPLAKHNYAVSHKVAERMVGQAEVIENFIDIKSIKRSQGNQVAFVGRLSHEKGPDHLLDIANRLKEIQVHIYGDGPMMQALRTEAGSNVFFHGQQQSMNHAWAAIGLLVITSRYEGLPMAAIEAMGRGIPVIAFRVGALATLIDDGVNGWLIEPGNIAEFEQKLSHWHRLSAREKHAYQQAAMQKIKQSFSSEAIIPKYLNRYQTLNSAVLPTADLAIDSAKQCTL